MRSRIVITGMGAITPLGNSITAFWNSLAEGQSGAGPITRFDPSNMETKIAAEVKHFDPLAVMDRKEARRSSRCVQLAVGAAREAVQAARLTIDEFIRDRVGVVIGTGIGGADVMLENYDVLRERGPRRVSPFFGPAMLPDTAAGQVAIEMGARGPNMAVVSACASGIDAIGQAAEMIRRGAADVMIAGGSESIIHPVVVAAFNVMKVLSTRNENPAEASRPFDADRDGFLLGEGSGIVILERLEDAQRRDAHIIAEVAGYGTAADAYHLAAPPEDGNGIFRAMKMALADASIQPEEIDYINPHGTGTPLNDKIETLAIKNVFGDWARRIPISSTKSMTGHLMGAAGAVEAIICAMAMRAGVAPPTINLHTPDPDCDLDYVPNTARPVDIRVALSNSIGLGGHNASLILRRV
ncbi:MAG: beta-ketoacyl-ACP synthase II [Anaerolineae bacterium]|nr:beta-ketoacyl-ACP synthase II [Anaerolineae bacterium]